MATSRASEKVSFTHKILAMISLVVHLLDRYGRQAHGGMLLLVACYIVWTWLYLACCSSTPERVNAQVRGCYNRGRRRSRCE